MSGQQTTLLEDFSSSVSSSLTSTSTTDFTAGLSFDGFIDNFHFIRPAWLLAFLALFIVLYLLKKIQYYQSPWQHFLPAHLSSALLENSQHSANQVTTSPSSYWLKPFIMGCCIITALAGPAWQKLPQPVYQLERGSVLIMDMSYSMFATDVKPNRLTRSRYKATDLLTKINEGDVGLVAYAGDAFIISPLTQDVKNIELLLPSLSPDIMPVHGANALAALILADKTLKNSGHVSGDIYWFTDDIDNEDMSDIYAWVNGNNHRVNILGVGTKNGAPIKLSSGELLKDNRGAIVIPKLPEGRLAAIAQRGRGVYRTMTNNDSDIKALTEHLTIALDDKLTTGNALNNQETKQALQGDQYLEQGPWLLIIILPLLLSYFRRGTSILAISLVMPLTLMATLVSFTPTAYAAASTDKISTPTATQTSPSPAMITEGTDTDTGSARQFWQNLWKTPNQQAQQHYQKEDYQQAAKQFEDSQWQGSAHYKAGDYEQALSAFKQSDSPQSLYNQGNALAQLQKVDEAIAAYKAALAKDPSLSDAKDNLAKLEAIKKQQEESKQDSQEPSKDGEKEQGDSQEDQQKQSQDKSQGEQQDGEPQDNQQSSEQNKELNKEQNEQQDEKKENQSQEAKDNAEEQKKQEEAAQANKSDEEQQGDEKSLAQQASDNKAQETQQKHQQLLNKVTDDPYLLLRNKMRLEYQKRRQEGASQGVSKKW